MCFVKGLADEAKGTGVASPNGDDVQSLALASPHPRWENTGTTGRKSTQSGGKNRRFQRKKNGEWKGKSVG